MPLQASHLVGGYSLRVNQQEKLKMHLDTLLKQSPPRRLSDEVIKAYGGNRGVWFGALLGLFFTLFGSFFCWWFVPWNLPSEWKLDN